MFHGFHQRKQTQHQPGLRKFASLQKSAIVDEFQKIRHMAASSFIMMEINLDSDADRPSESGRRAIQPVGKVKPEASGELKTDLGWTITKPVGGDYGTVLLEPGQHNGHDFVIDSYGLDSPHAFRRKF